MIFFFFIPFSGECVQTRTFYNLQMKKMPQRLRILFYVCLVVLPWSQTVSVVPVWSAAHVGDSLHNQQTLLSFSLLSSFRTLFFFFPFIWTFIQMSPSHLLRGVSPPSAPQFIVTRLSIIEFALYYYTGMKVRLQNKAAAAATDAPNWRGSLFPFLSCLLPHPRLRIDKVCPRRNDPADHLNLREPHRWDFES